MRSLFSAVEFIHSRQIIHRDIKPENIIFNNIEDFNSLKLCDFGLSGQYFDSVETEYCGTLIYMAPEQVEKKNYTKAIDIWSCGTIMYMLLNSGKHPLFYEGLKSKEYIELLKTFKWEFNSKVSK